MPSKENIHLFNTVLIHSNKSNRIQQNHPAVWKSTFSNLYTDWFDAKETEATIHPETWHKECLYLSIIVHSTFSLKQSRSLNTNYWSIASKLECKTKEIVDSLVPEVHFPDNAKASIVAPTSPALYRLLNTPERKAKNNVINKQKKVNGETSRDVLQVILITISMGEALSYPVCVLIH